MRSNPNPNPNCTDYSDSPERRSTGVAVVDPLEDNEKPGRPEREKTEHREEVGARSEREREGKSRS